MMHVGRNCLPNALRNIKCAKLQTQHMLIIAKSKMAVWPTLMWTNLLSQIKGSAKTCKSARPSFARACAEHSCWWAQLISSKPLFSTDQIKPNWLKICIQSLAASLKAGFLAMLQESILCGQESTAWRCAFTTSFKGLKSDRAAHSNSCSSPCETVR